MNNPAVITRDSGSSLEDVCSRLPDVAQRHRFGVLGLHDLKQKIQSKGLAFDRECRVFEVCNPQQAQEVLTQSIAVSTALPCRIAVYEENGRTVLATLKPTQLLGLFDAPGASQAAQAVETAMVEMMEEAAR